MAKLAGIILKKKIDPYLDENTTQKRNEFWFLTRQEITQHNVTVNINKLPLFIL
jgi:hypothetical protein